MYGEYLIWRGIEVREVGSGRAAVGELSKFRPDAIVTDDRLPDSTGPELVCALRRARHTFDLPIVLLCSDTFAIQADEAHRYGCDRIVIVPLLPEALLTVLDEVVAQYQERGGPTFESWLFTRDGESVWIVRTTELELSVAGPGAERAVFTFSSSPDLLSFQAEYEQRLTLGGFTLQTAGDDRRTGQDRRQAPRVSDRRSVQ
jgi:CheY-like chemotaxis protein